MDCGIEKAGGEKVGVADRVGSWWGLICKCLFYDDVRKKERKRGVV